MVVTTSTLATRPPCAATRRPARRSVSSPPAGQVRTQMGQRGQGGMAGAQNACSTSLLSGCCTAIPPWWRSARVANAYLPVGLCGLLAHSPSHPRQPRSPPLTAPPALCCPPCRPHPRYLHGQARQGVSGWPPGWCSCCSAGALSRRRPRSCRRGRACGKHRRRQRSACAAAPGGGGGPASGGGRARVGATAGAGGWGQHAPRLCRLRALLLWKHTSVTHAHGLVDQCATG